MSIYLDNAATTPLDHAVFKAMTPYLLDYFGNPSSHHEHGRQARTAIENARCCIAGLLNADPSEIIFTSGGTEADNTAILTAIRSLNIKQVVTTRLEHHAVLHTLSLLAQKGEINLSFMDMDHEGNLDLHHLEQLLAGRPRTFVSVMHANNEIGNLNDIDTISQICERHDAIFHSDTVQTMGHYRHDLQKLKLHFLAASAHKFHGPKGVGFIYCRKGFEISQLIQGGGQERKLRAGTENIHGIIGLAKALSMAYETMDEHQAYIQGLKSRMIARITEDVADVYFNGTSGNADRSLYTVLSVSLPALIRGVNLLQYLDDNGLSVSGGSACSTGSVSHVLKAINFAPGRDTVRFSFSKFNTTTEIDQAINLLAGFYKYHAA